MIYPYHGETVLVEATDLVRLVEVLAGVPGALRPADTAALDHVRSSLRLHAPRTWADVYSKQEPGQ